MSTSAAPTTPQIDSTTSLSLALVLALLAGAQFLSTKLLSPSTPTRLRILFIWHAFDALIHFIFEGSFLYNCFFTFIPVDLSTIHPASLPLQNWLGHTDRLYGSFYAGPGNYFAELWKVYAAADKRWGVADPTVVSLELLTVLIGGPLAVWICVMIMRRDPRVSIWIIVLATAELYGGFMTFCPEWLTGSPNLDASNWMFLWLYLVFFNTLWVWLPLYAIYVAYDDITNAFSIRNGVIAASLVNAKKQSMKAGKDA